MLHCRLALSTEILTPFSRRLQSCRWLWISSSVWSRYTLNCHERRVIFVFSSSSGQTLHESHSERMRGRRGERGDKWRELLKCFLTFREKCLDKGLSDPPSFSSPGLQLHSLYLSVLHSCAPLQISQLYFWQCFFSVPLTILCKTVTIKTLWPQQIAVSKPHLQFGVYWHAKGYVMRTTMNTLTWLIT